MRLERLERAREPAATQAGDLKTARIAHEALGKLLDAPGGASVVVVRGFDLRDSQ